VQLVYTVAGARFCSNWIASSVEFPSGAASAVETREMSAVASVKDFIVVA
jgi:hypothetical protein